MENKRAVSMEPHSVGELLTEVSRAHLHQGTPSALVKRLMTGVDKFLTECTNPDEKTLCTQLRQDLEVMYDTWRAKEDSHYSM